MPQIATEELRIALRLQTLVRQIIRATLEHERELEQLWKLNKPRSLQTFLVPPRWDLWRAHFNGPPSTIWQKATMWQSHQCRGWIRS